MSQSFTQPWLTRGQGGVSGIEFLDTCLAPTDPQGQLFGLLGPIGVGKSTLGAMIAVEGAKAAYARRLKGQAPESWVYLNFDGTKNDLELRMISHGAKIARNQPDRCSIRENLSSIGNYYNYEIRDPRNFRNKTESCSVNVND